MELRRHSEFAGRHSIPLVKYSGGDIVVKQGSHWDRMTPHFVDGSTYWLFRHDDGVTLVGKALNPVGLGVRIETFRSAEDAREVARKITENVTHWLDPDAVRKCIVERKKS
ncbi:MAG: hypothetical protein JW834_02100 [Candidatus Diapherotrites archaeon]|nr:hypothetical protein [Candidatus Diapherotrites archaeon]